MLIDKCFSCKKNKFFVKYRKLRLPIGEVKSREKFCNKCIKELQAEISK